MKDVSDYSNNGNKQTTQYNNTKASVLRSWALGCQWNTA